MACLGETCTHVAAILFHSEALYRIHGSETCTQHKFEWVIPKFRKDMDYLPVNVLSLLQVRVKRGSLMTQLKIAHQTVYKTPVRE